MKFGLGWLFLATSGAVAAAPNAAPLIVPVITAGAGWQFTAMQPDGKLLVNGARGRLNTDGTVDSQYVYGGPNLSVGAAAVAPGGTIYLLCLPTDFDNTDAETLVALSPSGSLLFQETASTRTEDMYLLAQSDGKIVLWSHSDYVSIAGSAKTVMTRLNTDGSIDPNFNIGAGPTGPIYSVTEQADGKILVGGLFFSFDNVPAPGLVRLNPNGTLDPSFTAAATLSAPAGPVLALPGGDIVAWFYDDGGGLYLLNPDGSISAQLGVFNVITERIYALALQPDGRFLVGGSFSIQLGGTPVYDLVRFNADGSLDPTFNPRPALSNIYPGTIEELSLAVSPSGAIVFALDPALGLPPAVLNPDGSADFSVMQAAGSPPAGQVAATARSPDGRFFLAGAFLAADGLYRPGMAAVAADGAVDPQFAPTVGLVWNQVNDPKNGLAAQIAVAGDGSVYVVGSFSGVGNASCPGIARFLANGAFDPQFAPVLNSGGAFTAIAALADGRVAVGGQFSSINGQLRSNIAAFGPGGTLDPAFGTLAALNSGVTAIAPISGGGCFIGGTFTKAGTVYSNYVGELNSDSSVSPNFSSTGLAAAPVAMAVLVGGEVAVATSTGAVRLNSSGAIDLSYSMPQLLGFSNQPGYAINLASTPTALVPDPSGGFFLTIFQVFDASGLAPTILRGSFIVHFDAGGNVLPFPPLNFSYFDADYPSIQSLALASDGSLAAAGPFTTISGEAAFGTVIFPNADIAAGSGPLVLATTNAPASTAVSAGAASSFSVSATDGGWPSASGGLTYQWQLNGMNLSGATGAAYSLPAAGTADSGTYTVVVSNSSGSLDYTAGTLSVLSDAWLANLSVLATVQPSNTPLSAGFVIGGNGNKTILIRGIGPQLARTFDVAGALPDPQLTVSTQSGAVVERDTGWDFSLTTMMASAGAFPLSLGSADSAIAPSLPPGAYSAAVASAGGNNGIALVELYDTSPGNTSGRLVNLSTLSFVGSGGATMTSGFVVGGTTSETVLIRAVGPELSRTFGMTGAVAQPVLTVFDGTGKPIASNTGWGQPPQTGLSTVNAGIEAATASEMAAAGAFPLATGSADCALVLTLPPGNYTAQVTGANGTRGDGLVEIYEFP